MKNLWFITMLLVLPLFTSDEVWGETATPQEMEVVCTNWLAYMVHETGAWAGETTPRITNVDELVDDGIVLAHIFSISPQGYIAVPILKELPPIKCYSEKNGFDVKQTVGFPQLLREVLANRIDLFIETYGDLSVPQRYNGKELFDEINRKEWDRYLESPATFAASLKGGRKGRLTGKGPLLTTAWHQHYPYNLFCPMGNSGKCVAGCVAIAAAQIMKFHNWPPIGEGSHTYWWEGDGPSVPGQNLYAHFEDVYDWLNMPDTDTGCTPEEEDAVAELCYEVGVAFEINYGSGGSGSSLPNPETVFEDYFRYENDIEREERDEYTAQSWFDMIKQEINADRPMWYCIYCHAIVCDGWREINGIKEYHINYGWTGGSNTDWYTIDNIAGSIYPMNEWLLRNIMPNDDNILKFFVPNDWMNVHDALQNCPEMCEILVKPGTYEGKIDFLGKTVKVKSTAGASRTIIKGDRTGSVVTFANGEGMYSVLEGFTITNGDGNYGGGIICKKSTPTIKNNVIESNSAAMGGGICCIEAARPIVSNNMLSNNTASMSGGGISCNNRSLPYVTNNTITLNLANDEGGGIYADKKSFPVVTNTISWDNYARLDPEISGNLEVTYCNVMGGYHGAGNIMVDPRFVSEKAGDFHLKWTSPCVNAGTNEAPWLSSDDFEGDPRIFKDTADIGADEFYTHLYVTGDQTPGGSIQGKFVGLPGTYPVGLFMGFKVSPSPVNTMWGEFWLQAPWLLLGPLGAIPSEGVMVLPTTLPSGITVPVDIPMQALIGLNANSLSNLCVLEIR